MGKSGKKNGQKNKYTFSHTEDRITTKHWLDQPVIDMNDDGEWMKIQKKVKKALGRSTTITNMKAHWLKTVDGWLEVEHNVTGQLPTLDSLQYSESLSETQKFIIMAQRLMALKTVLANKEAAKESEESKNDVQYISDGGDSVEIISEDEAHGSSSRETPVGVKLGKAGTIHTRKYFGDGKFADQVTRGPNTAGSLLAPKTRNEEKLTSSMTMSDANTQYSQDDFSKTESPEPFFQGKKFFLLDHRDNPVAQALAQCQKFTINLYGGKVIEDNFAKVAIVIKSFDEKVNIQFQDEYECTIYSDELLYRHITDELYITSFTLADHIWTRDPAVENATPVRSRCFDNGVEVDASSSVKEFDESGSLSCENMEIATEPDSGPNQTMQD